LTTACCGLAIFMSSSCANYAGPILARHLQVMLGVGNAKAGFIFLLPGKATALAQDSRPRNQEGYPETLNHCRYGRSE
jgi:hypothetical protein